MLGKDDTFIMISSGISFFMGFFSSGNSMKILSMHTLDKIYERDAVDSCAGPNQIFRAYIQ
jgi:hypothetical protein